MLKRAVVFHHPQSEGALAFAQQLARELAHHGLEIRVFDVWGEVDEAALSGAGLAICVGGDGTVLRAARLMLGHDVPLLGVNMGRLGFLTDMSPRDLFNNLERVVAEDWRLEDRLMVRAEVHTSPGRLPVVHHGLNDIVVSRRSPGRPIYVDAHIDGARLAVYRCDGIIVATPTGSTGYSLSAGGPILAPSEHHLVVTPVSAHLALGRSLVLQPDSVVDLRLTSDHGAILSVDGQDDIAIDGDAVVTARSSEYTTRFVRFRDPASFYSELAEKLEFQLSSAVAPRA